MRHTTAGIAFRVARRVITPQYAEQQLDSDTIYERSFSKLLMPILQHYDRKLCFLFELFNQIPGLDFKTLAEFTDDVCNNSNKYNLLLHQGIYPPFAWHELQASRKLRRPIKTLEESCRPLFLAIKPDMMPRAEVAIDCLTVLKEYELNYNNYNYKGRFGLISKLQYYETAQLLPTEASDRFLEAILLDRFYDALTIIEASTNR